MARNNAYDLYYPYELIRFVQNIEDTEWAFQKFEDEIKCLVCSSEGEREIFDEDELEDHINDFEHQENCKKMFYDTVDDEVASFLSIYHKFWNECSPSLQIHQFYFSPRDEFTTYCDICETYLTYNENNINKHVYGNTHQSNLSEDGSLPWTNQEESSKIYYPFDLLVDVMGITGNNMSLNIQRLERNYFHCLACDLDIVGDFTQLKNHLESDNHQCKMDKESRNLYCYHHSWLNDYTDDFQFKQIFFTPHDEDTAYCKVCDRELNYQGLDDHYYKSSTHKRQIRKWEVHSRLSHMV